MESLRQTQYSPLAEWIEFQTPFLYFDLNQFVHSQCRGHFQEVSMFLRIPAASLTVPQKTPDQFTFAFFDEARVSGQEISDRAALMRKLRLESSQPGKSQ
jgi:hypothetical protein